MDERIQRVVWHGRIACRFRIDTSAPSAFAVGQSASPAIIRPTASTSSLTAHSTQVDALYMMLSRCAYLPLLVGGIRKHFIDRGVEFQGTDMDVWFSHRHRPLPWHYPIGLLVDLMGDGELPWEVEVHFGAFPVGQLVQMPSYDAPLEFFMSKIKEADVLRHGSARMVMGLTKAEQTHLWESVWTDNFDKHQRANAKLVDPSIGCKHVPVRLYVDSNPPLQDLIPPTHFNGQVMTLGDALVRLAPKLFDCNVASTASSLQQRNQFNSSAVSLVATPHSDHPSQLVLSPAQRISSPLKQQSPSGVDLGLASLALQPPPSIDAPISPPFHSRSINDASRPLSSPSITIPTNARNLRDVSTDTRSSPAFTVTASPPFMNEATMPDMAARIDTRVVLHGVTVPLDVPLLWLSHNMSYADNFLHLVIRTDTKS